MTNNPNLGLCPDCKAVISRSASSCPKCGRPIGEGDLLELPKQSQGCQKGCLTIFVLFLVLLVIMWIIGNQEMRRNNYPASKSPASGDGSGYQRTSPGYDANAPLLPRDKDDIGPLYNEVERRKKEQGISDREAVRQIIEEQERAKPKR